MTAFTDFNIATGAELEAALKAAAIEAAIAKCPEAAYHESGAVPVLRMRLDRDA